MTEPENSTRPISKSSQPEKNGPSSTTHEENSDETIQHHTIETAIQAHAKKPKRRASDKKWRNKIASGVLLALEIGKIVAQIIWNKNKTK